MQLHDMGKKLSNNDVINYKSTLRGSYYINQITEEKLAKCDDVIFILNSEGQAIRKIDKNLLIFLVHENSLLTYAHILDNIEEGVIAVDRRGKIFYLNNAYTDILGVTPSKILGKYIQNVEPNSLLANTITTHRELQSKRTKITTVNKYVALHIIPIFIKGQFEGAYSIFQDVTEVQDLNKKLLRLNKLVNDLQTNSDVLDESDFRLLDPVPNGTLEEMMKACEKQLIEHVLNEENNNRTQTILRLGLSRRTFYRKCAEHGIEKISADE